MGGPSGGSGFAAGLSQVGKQGGSLFGPPAAKPSGGGIAYGAASSAGGLFGPPSAAGAGSFASGLSSVGKMGGIGGAASGLGGTQFGASKAGAGGFALGGASKFQSGGSLAFGTAGAAFGGAPPGQSDDPYDIPLDLTKIKAKKQPEKLFEEKSSQEKLMTMKQVEN